MANDIIIGLWNLLLAGILAAFVKHSIRTGAAVGLWWDYLRSTQPIRFWVYVGVMAAASLGNAIEGVAKLVGEL